MDRRFVKVLLVLTLGLLAVTIWSTGRALQVRSDLAAVQRQASQVRTELQGGDVDRAVASFPALTKKLDQAAGRTVGPVWTVAEHLPLVRGNFQAVRRTAQAAQILGRQALPEAQQALMLVRGNSVFRDGQVDLAVLRRLHGHIEKAAGAAARADDLVSRRPALVLWPVSGRYDEARRTVGVLSSNLHATSRALAVAPEMLGATAARRYFVAVQNNAEARATGGLIGAFALVRADQGKITLERTGVDSELRNSETAVPFDPASAPTWRDIGSTVAWQDSNLTPHFPDAARNIVGLWRAQGGEPLDGVLALDPLVMSTLLKDNGSVRLPDGTAINAGNVVDFVGRDEYVRYPDRVKRQRVLGTLAADVFHRVLNAHDGVATLQNMLSAGRSGHLYLWSARAQEQQALGTGLLSGALPGTPAPYLSVLTQNFGGNKLDFYLRRSVVVTRQRDGLLKVRVSLRNTAPDRLPSIVAGREDHPRPPVPYAQAKIGFTVYGALYTEFAGVEVDGKPAPMGFDRDHGHRMGTLALELPRGKPVVVTILLTQPKGVLVYRKQPLVVPDTVRIDGPHTVLG